MALPASFISELKARLSITDIVSSYVNLKRRGRNMIGLCPFHSEKTPSFTLYPENGSFCCFGCGVGGDIITFTMKIENLDYIEAVKLLAAKAGMSMPEDSYYDDSIAKLKGRILEANREAARFFHAQLMSENGKAAQEYLMGRALSRQTVVRFGLGYAPANRFALSSHLRKKGFKDEEIVAANLAFQKSGGKGIVDRFSDRVMFPIIDLRGNVIAFGGRILTDQKPKYLNTSDTLVFKKSANLFSLNNAKNSGLRTLILCEGYMDVIAVNAAGFQNAVATLGTALTSEQALLMKRYADEVIICYDADEAGQKATARAIEILRNAGLVIRVLTVPDGKDPDEFIRKNGDRGQAAFKNLIESSGNDVEYRLTKIRLMHDLGRPDSKAAYMKEALKVISGLDSVIEQDIYCSRLSEELGIRKDAITEDLNKLKASKRKDDYKKEYKKVSDNLVGNNEKLNSERKQNIRGAKAEEMLIAYIFHNPDMLKKAEELISDKDFVTTFNLRFYQYISDKIKSGLPPDLSIAQDFTSDEVSRFYYIINSYNSQTATVAAMKEYIDTIKFEKGKLSKQDLADMSAEEIMLSMKNRKKPKP
ncbi:MAG: DNA primase [Ruminococcaceae bacterium]|nr:DNA primase [Oscillospiraceae bacterium]